MDNGFADWARESGLDLNSPLVINLTWLRLSSSFSQDANGESMRCVWDGGEDLARPLALSTFAPASATLVKSSRVPLHIRPTFTEGSRLK